MDVIWLQRDFGVYVVGLFDTHQAAKVLKLGRLSLKHLLMRYCHVDTDKKLVYSSTPGYLIVKTRGILYIIYFCYGYFLFFVLVNVKTGLTCCINIQIKTFIKCFECYLRLRIYKHAFRRSLCLNVRPRRQQEQRPPLKLLLLLLLDTVTTADIDQATLDRV